jgi:predicted Zn-dependent protease with MMP-like domain
MLFEDFESAARAAYDEIPEPYKEGIDALVVSRESVPHPDHADVYTLGECRTDEHMSDYGSPDTTRSVIALYWGSFTSLARHHDNFDWEGELWETLTHELRHHLESLAGDDALEAVDYAAEQTFNRDEGRDFDPWYFQHGEEVAPGLYQVEASFYLEQAWQDTDFEATRFIDFLWEEIPYRLPRPTKLGDVHFVWVEGVAREGTSVELVLVRRRTWWEDAKRMVATYRPVILESKAVAERVVS